MIAALSATARPLARALPSRLRRTVGAADLRSRLCACSTPPTGTSDAASTASGCSSTRRTSSTTWSRSCATRRVDVVVVAGDVYDRALPSVDTVRLLNDAVERIVDAGAQLRADQRQPRLRRPAGLRRPGARARRRAPAHAGSRTSLAPSWSPTTTAVALYGVPYLEPRTGRGPRWARERSHHGRAVRGDGPGPGRPRHREPAARVRCWPRTPSWSAARSATPSATSASAGVGSVPRVFDGAGLRRARPPARARSGSSEAVRYSGSPLALLVRRGSATARAPGWSTSAPTGPAARSRRSEAPVPRPLAVLRGDLERPARATRGTRARRASWCQVTLTDAGPAAGRDGAAARPLPAHAGRSRSRRAARRPGSADVRHSVCAVRSRSTSAAASSSTCAAASRSSSGDRALLREALEGGSAGRDGRGGPATAARTRCGMRLHRLRVEAFGPVRRGRGGGLRRPRRGLFLLHGPDRRGQVQRAGRRLLRALRPGAGCPGARTTAPAQ